MKYPPDKLEPLVDIIVGNVLLWIIDDLVKLDKIGVDVAKLQKQAPQDLGEAKRFVARRVVEAYNDAEKIPALCQGIFRQCRGDPGCATAIHDYWRSVAPKAAAQQASIVSRANTMEYKRLMNFMIENEPRICVILACLDGEPNDVRGTGFLVGPDRVLTAYHTVKHHIADGEEKAPPPGKLYAVFDHLEGEQVKDPERLPEGAKRVEFAEEWLLAYSEDWSEEGVVADPTPAQLAEMKRRLDFALIRLKEPVGLHARSFAGGRRRLWVDLKQASGALRATDRIIIPQHPNGDPQRIDFGRFKENDQSQTRIRYDAETQTGSSGAPCFDHRFNLVGLHNAEYDPALLDARANQAVRADLIVKKLGDAAEAKLEAQSEPRPWNLSRDPRKPEVILGRTNLLDWIEAAATENPGSRAARIYAAISDKKKSGKTFTGDILKAARRGKGEPIVVLGSDEQIPSSVPDFIHALADQLGLPRDQLVNMPSRPAPNLPADSADGDKLGKWAPEQIPKWLDGVIAEHRTKSIDARIDAKERVKALRQAGLRIDAATQELADSPVEVIDTQNRWTIAWVVLDQFVVEKIPNELLELIAALTGNVAEASMPQELRRLRWLFLGELPPFLADDAKFEKLDPVEIGPKDLVEAYQSMAISYGRTCAPETLAEIMIWAQACTLTQPFTDPVQRLERLQEFFGNLAPLYAKRMGIAL